MKIKTILLLITLLPAIVNAQWVQANLPPITYSKNALADKFVEFNNTIYAGSFYYGLFHSTDDGNNDTYSISSSSTISKSPGTSFFIESYEALSAK